jgi:hypothetical protein
VLKNGVKFFDQKTKHVISSFFNYTVLEPGVLTFGTFTLPCSMHLLNQSAWNAGISVLRDTEIMFDLLLDIFAPESSVL